MFEPHPEDADRLVHSRLDEEAEKQRQWSEKSRKGGQKSAAARKEKAQAKQTGTTTEPTAKGGSQVVQPNGNSSSSFSSSDKREREVAPVSSCESEQPEESSCGSSPGRLPERPKVPIPSALQTAAFQSAWRRWLDWVIRRSCDEVDPTRAEIWLEQLASRGESKAIADLDYTIGCGIHHMIYDSQRGRRSARAVGDGVSSGPRRVKPTLASLGMM